MKRIQLITIVAAMSAVVCTTQAGVEKPNVMPEAMVSITVSDLHGFLDGVGMVASKVSPMMSGQMIKGMVGGQINDPTLAGIPTGKGLAIVALDANTVFAVLEVAEAQSTSYAQVAAGMGMQTNLVDGALVIAQTIEALERGGAALGSVKSSLLSKRAPVLSITGQPAMLIEKNRATIDMSVGMLPMVMAQGMMQQPGATLESAQSMTKFMQGYIAVMLSLAEQCESLEIKLAPKGGDLEMSKTFVAKEGSELGKLVNAPAVYKSNPAIHAGAMTDATVLYDFLFENPDALAAFFAVESDKLMKKMMIEETDSATTLAAMTKWFKAYGGSGCERVRFGGEDLFDVAYVAEVSDVAVAMDALKTMNTDLAPFFKLYESLGMPITMTFKENVREVGGVKVHELGIGIGMSSMMADQQALVKQMGMDDFVCEIAFADGLAFYSAPGKLETLMKTYKDGAAKGAAPIKARGVYPAGGFAYMDYDIGSYLKFASQAASAGGQGANELAQLAAALKGAPPLVGAGFKENGCVMLSTTVSGEMLSKVGEFAMMMQMQKMQQQMQQQQMAPPAGATP